MPITPPRAVAVAAPLQSDELRSAPSAAARRRRRSLLAEHSFSQVLDSLVIVHSARWPRLTDDRARFKVNYRTFPIAPVDSDDSEET